MFHGSFIKLSFLFFIYRKKKLLAQIISFRFVDPFLPTHSWPAHPELPHTQSTHSHRRHVKDTNDVHADSKLLVYFEVSLNENKSISSPILAVSLWPGCDKSRPIWKRLTHEELTVQASRGPGEETH